MEDVKREGYGDTAVNMYMCRNTHYRRIDNVGGKDSGSGSIAGLMLLCENSTFERVRGIKGPFIFGVQIKGGVNCKAINCELVDVVAGANISMNYGFYNRGDAPWGASPTTGLTYPWADLGWTVPDPRRASVNCQYIDCLLSNCHVNFWAYHSQEFIGGGFYRSRALKTSGGNSGFSVLKLSGGSERDFDVLDNRHENGGGGTGHGFAFISSDATALKGIRVRDNRSNKAGYRAFTSSRVEFDEFSGNVGIDAAQAADPAYLDAFRFEVATVAKLSGNTALDTRSTPVHASGFASDSSTIGLAALGNEVVGFATRPFAFAAPVNWGEGNSSAFRRTTTNAIADTAGFIFTPPVGGRVYVEFLVTGRDSTGVVGVWKIAGLFSNDAGTVAQSGATQQLMTAINPGAWTGPALQIVSNSVRLAPAGKASTTIEWTGKVTMQSM